MSINYASAVIRSENNSPDEIARAIGISPVHRPIPRRPPRAWMLQSREVESENLSDHIDWILDQIGDPSRLDAVRALDGELTMWISCFVADKEGSGGPLIYHDTIARLARYELDLVFDLYIK